ncbi:hypothetical protein C0Q70_04213 [Pomacea canaliculata]|uniref:Uncharacterized protein n=1 Tax=Pomacea canaliculata TaxID=400727 RepID=A0A2T7PUX3_POMCA|nr:hypothetical protein C0Q70_04213 [Pomacea canaliculata]
MRISQNLLTTLSKHYQNETLAPRLQKKGGRKNSTRSLSTHDVQEVVNFNRIYAEDNDICLSGRVPGFEKEDIRLLSSAIPKSGKYEIGANMTCNEKYELLQEQQQHLNQVQAERREFRDIVNKCKTVAQHHLKRLQASQHSKKPKKVMRTGCEMGDNHHGSNVTSKSNCSGEVVKTAITGAVSVNSLRRAAPYGDGRPVFV